MNEATLILDLIEELVLANTENQVEFSEKATTIAPNYVVAAAKKGLAIREKQSKSNKCCLAVGLARANQLVNKEPLSLSTLKRMKSFLARHGSALNNSKPDLESKQSQAIMLWGAFPTKASINKVTNWLDREINRIEAN